MNLFLNTIGHKAKCDPHYTKPHLYIYTLAYTCVCSSNVRKYFLKYLKCLLAIGTAYVFAIFNMTHWYFSTAKYLNCCSYLMIILPFLFSLEWFYGFKCWVGGIGGCQILYLYLQCNFLLGWQCLWWIWKGHHDVYFNIIGLIYEKWETFIFYFIKSL